MKKILILVLGVIVALSTFHNVSAQSMFAKKKPLPNTRGKANVKDLAKEIHDAMLTGNTGRVVIFMPTNDELKELRKADKVTDETKELVAKLDAKELEKNLLQDLDNVNAQLNAKSTMPALTTLTEVTSSRPNAKIPVIIPVTVTLTDEKQKTETLAFEAIKIDKRVYLFRNLQMKSEMQAVNLKEGAVSKP